MKIAYIAFALMFIISVAGAAELTDYLGQTITAIELSDSVGADSFLVLNSSGLIPGELLTADKLQEAIKRIYAIGLYADVVIKGEKAGNGVKIRIETKQYPRLAEIRYKGNKKVKTKNLKKQVNLTEGRIVSPGAIKNCVEAIKKLYEEKGYLLAQVESSIEPDKTNPGRVVVTLRIDEGQKVRIKNITFTGNAAFSDDKLRGKLGNKRKSFFRSGSFDSEKYNEDKKKIVDFYKERGYIDAVVTGDSIWYSNDLRWMYIRLRIKEGPLYYFGKFTWKGNSVLDDSKVASAFKVKEGQTYNEDKYQKSLSKLYELYQDEGYWYTRIEEHKSPRDVIMDVEFEISEGEPAYVKMINIAGNTKTKEKVIRRELKIKPDTIFKRSILTRSLRDVMILNFFKDVQPDLAVRDDNNIDLTLKIEEKETGTFSMGAGYSAQDKLVGTIGLGFPNFFGGGQTVSLDAEYGSARLTFNLSYYEPWFRDTPTSIGLNIYYQERVYTDWFTEGTRGGSIQVGRRLRWPDNYCRIYGGYRLEELKYYSWTSSYVADNVDNAYSVDKFSWPKISSVATISLERDSRDLAQFATKGSVYSWAGSLAGTVLGGSYNYWKQIYNIHYYYTPFWKFSFSAKGKWGLVAGIKHGDGDVPFSERFTPGGTDTDGLIRGYNDSEIGPRSASGGYLGGRSEVIYNAELTVPIAEQQFYVLLFADAGNAYLTGDGLRDHMFSNFYKSAGFGFRVVAPMIGIIGFDFGYPFNGDNRGKLKPHFQIGRGF
jgi:outer membrane protein insertion porin family